MKANISVYSESLVLSLCKEIEYIKSRSKNIAYSLKFCQNELLSKRLRLELKKLNTNRTKILNISEKLFKKNSDNLSIELLLEICRRSNSFQQI